VVRDALAAYIAKNLKIAHLVDIIAYNISFPGKIHHNWPATIHTIAPGETVRKQRGSKYNALRLKQLWAHASTFEQKGLTRQIINHMTWHKQLPIIIALDLLIGNSDRHCGNLCYDPETDSFCAIDMDDTFNKDLCEIAYKKLFIMLNDPKIVFTSEEITAFVQLRKTLMYLLSHYESRHMIKKMYYFAKKTGFVSGSSLYTPSIEKKLTTYAETITQSWISARKLVKVLETIIKINNK